MNAANDEDKRLELLFFEALRGLTQQQAALDNLRSRATVLLAAAALVSSLLGAPVLQAGNTGWEGWLALASLGGVLVTSLAVNAPLYRWYFRTNPSALLEAVHQGHTLDSMRKHLAVDFGDYVRRNQTTLTRLQWTLITGMILLVVELVMWALALPGG